MLVTMKIGAIGDAHVTANIREHSRTKKQRSAVAPRRLEPQLWKNGR